ncbi:CDGSH iron-sulfur domain-containing protein [Rhodococcoides fascians A25f]|uniref:CDGSH iron-sulfur domain-containing protein n=1 Tax=Rhodococcoides fascians TaxID=1828 RepID=UPI00055DD61A|nr:CDGSH iron-sulfur domain-containing protein [Rhodococcus fascians A25f]
MPTDDEGGADGDNHGPAASTTKRTTVRIVKGGPIVIDGPVDIELDDGTRVCSDRFAVAVCTCRRSKNYPLCDTSHRAKKRPAQSSEDRPADQRDIT